MFVKSGSAAPSLLAHLFVQLALLITTVPAALAAGPDSSSTAALPASGARAIEFDGKLYLGGSRTTEAGTPTSANQWSTLSASVSHPSSGMALGTLLGYTHTTDEETSNGETDNPVFTLSKSWENEEGWLKRTTVGVSVLAPSTRATREKTFQGAIGPFAEFATTVSRWSLSENLSYAQGFYDTRTSIDSSDTVVPTAAKAATTIAYSFTEKLVAEAIIQFLRAWTFENTVADHSMWSVGLTYEINKNFSIDGGVGNNPGLLVPNPYYEQLNFDSPQARLVFMDLTLSI